MIEPRYILHEIGHQCLEAGIGIQQYGRPVAGPSAYSLAIAPPPPKIKKVFGLRQAFTAAIDCPAPVDMRQAGRWVIIDIPREDRQFVSPAKLEAKGPAVPIGVSARGSVVSIDLNDTPHVFAGGQTGSGKSTAIETLAAGLAMHPEQNRIAIAAMKGKKDFRSLENAAALEFEIVRRDQAGASAMIRWAYTELEARATGKAWNRRIILIIDECQKLAASDHPRLHEIASEGRAFDVHLFATTQYLKAKILNTETSDQFGARIVGRFSSQVGGRLSGASNAEDLTGKGDCYVNIAGKLERVQIAYAPPDDPFWQRVPRTEIGPAPIGAFEDTTPAPVHPSQQRRAMPHDVRIWALDQYAKRAEMPGINRIAQFARKATGSCSNEAAKRWQSELIDLVSAPSGVSAGNLIAPDWPEITQNRDRITRIPRIGGAHG